MGTYELIAIGASWGGLHALERLLSALPDDFRTPIAVAQHRAVDSGHGGLTTLLSRHGNVDAREASDKEPVEPGRVYVAPADYHLLVEPEGFALSIDELVQYSRPSVDVLFESAADTYGPALIAVVLTGLGADGAHGLEVVKRRGGLTVVQDPACAERSSMPEAAIATGCADRVLGLDEIAALLVELCTPSASAGKAA